MGTLTQPRGGRRSLLVLPPTDRLSVVLQVKHRGGGKLVGWASVFPTTLELASSRSRAKLATEAIPFPPPWFVIGDLAGVVDSERMREEQRDEEEIVARSEQEATTDRHDP